MVKYRTKLIDIVDDVKDIIVCGIDRGQMQSCYLLIGGEIHYCVMTISKTSTKHYSHEYSIETVKNYIENRRDELFSIFDIEYMLSKSYYDYDYVIPHMKEHQKRFGREYKIKQLIA